MSNEKSGRARSIRFVGGALVAMCLLAIAFGSLVSTIWDDDESDAVAPPTTIAAARVPDTLATTRTSTVAVVLAPPAVAFNSTCPAPGSGWQLSPVWPGDLPGLVRYDVEIRNPDDTWTALPAVTNPQNPEASLSGQPANAAYTLRLTAVLNGDSRVPSEPTIVLSPATDC